MPYSPHNFSRPFNGIDAIGRFLLIVSILISVCLGYLFIGNEFFDTPLGEIQTHYPLMLILLSISVFLCFGCGIGLCLRLAFARWATIIISAVTCIALFILLGLFLSKSYLIALPIAVVSIPVVVVLSTIIYLFASVVREEFTSRSIDINPSGRPYKPFVICMLILGFLLSVIGLGMFDYFIACFGEKFFGMPDVFLSMTTISLFGLAVITFGGVFTLLFSILLLVKSDSGRALMVIHGILNAIALFALFAGFSLHKEIEKNIFTIICLVVTGLGFSYIGWSIFRYLRSRQARILFIKSLLKKSPPSKEIVLTIVTGCVGIILVCTIAVSSLLFRQSKFVHGMAAVSAGMTKPEVRNLLGDPSGTGARSETSGWLSSKHPEYWVYFPPLDYGFHLFGPSSYAFVVFFNEDGKVLSLRLPENGPHVDLAAEVEELRKRKKIKK